MSSKKPTPPAGYPALTETTRRAQSQAERDMGGLEARRQRELDRAIPEFEAEDATGKYAGEELQMHRRARSHSDRIERLEKKHDKHGEKLDSLTGDVAELKGDVKEVRGEVAGLRGEVIGQMNGQDRVLKNIESTMTRLANREEVDITTRVELHKADKMSEIKVEEEKKLSATKIEEEKRIADIKDEADRKAARRKIVTKIVGGVAGGAGIVELLHRIFG